ncbi:probable cytochrome P450 49a1 [Trichonephila inaurata madagascariensis]|uniref:Probable cytochrome P450 49a1 n=1 Tax=Trichonephila inaurata madagascariensis TaxID=2747483 RepID=A0A8X6KLM9_9ARAC|nr:probable cytochrome P450 49a1 [Trichonephila inaurata madagascariensis]
MFGNTCRNSFRRIVTSIEKKPETNEIIRSFDEMPGPKPLPIIGNLWRYFPIIGNYSFERIHKTYAKLHEEYGPIVKEKVFGDRTLVHVFDPYDMYKVYQSGGNSPIRMSHRALARYRRARPHLYSGPGLFPSNGEEWRRFRSMFQKLLLSSSTIDGCSEALEDVTDEMVAKIPTCLNEKNEMDLQPLLFSWALECIGVVTLNRRLGCLSAEGNKEAASLIKAANDTHTAVFRTESIPFSITSYKKLEAAQNLFSSVVEKYLDQTVEEFKKGRCKESLLVKMLQLEEASRRDVFTMILDMFMAGIDTTAFTLSFGLYNLAKNKKVQQKLREETMKYLPTKSSRFSGTPLSQRQYLNSVIKETLRVNPVAVGTGRVIQKDLELGGYCVPAQTMVILQHQVASMQEKFFPNASQFDPERWTRRDFTPLVSSPFGYGGRLCIGKNLANRELYLAFSKMVRNFDISYHYDDIDSVNRLINVPDKPLKLRLEKVPE